ncbi:Tryptophanyl-tRNA synthetase [Niveomyces insectorum RCEF 264]|uniref:Tryptophanyl-tRNA synthetase n=1 Tax=Niveomyces insectorum RCEF 264 TaxID=1081102 RepID=A0A167YQ36_9HYPO|nr:Tryptophanyl-tRNA synthetase [Niveomyces insectorum RCEF 264]
MAAPVASQTYSRDEDAEIEKWLTTAERLKTGEPAGQSSILAELNTHLASRTTVLGAKPSKADVALYQTLAPTVKSWTPEQRTGKEGLPHIVRHVDFVQNSPAVFGLTVADADKVVVNPDEVLYVAPPVDAKAEKERLKKEKAAAAAAAAAAGTTGGATGEETKLADRTKQQQRKAPKSAEGAVKDAPAETESAAAPAAAVAAATASAGVDESKKREKKEKKEKQPRPQKAPPAPAAPLSPALIDLRVGHILKAIKHPEADSLYVSTIAMGDPAGTPDTEEYEGQVVRTVCSGLNGLVPLEEMQGRRVVVVCNLKPVKMRGVKSAAMVLAASPRPSGAADAADDHHAGAIELVNPPADAPAGTKVFFEGWQGNAEKQLNPKKKVWELFQPGFTTTDNLEVGFDAGVVKELGKTGTGRLVTENGGVCTVKSLKGATVR